MAKYVCSECGGEVQGDAVTVADCYAHPLAMIVEAKPLTEVLKSLDPKHAHATCLCSACTYYRLAKAGEVDAEGIERDLVPYLTRVQVIEVRAALKAGR